MHICCSIRKLVEGSGRGVDGSAMMWWWCAEFTKIITNIIIYSAPPTRVINNIIVHL